MAYQEKPITQIELVGKVGYRLYSYVAYGRVKYRAKFGIPKYDAQTGDSYLIPFMEDDSTRDYEAAVQLAAPQLEQLRSAAFRQQSLRGAATTSSLKPETEPKLELEEGDLPRQLKIAGS